MKHPFDGIIATGPDQLPPDESRPTRRSALARVLAATAGALAGLLGRSTFAQSYPNRRTGPPTTLALGEEGGAPRWPPRPPAWRPPSGPWRPGGGMTTFAVGEEGGRPPVTTYAVGEEGGRPPVTTYAVGEEGGAWPPRRPPGGGQPTTLALGEEGGAGGFGSR